jgi:hypothetical protein
MAQRRRDGIGAVAQKRYWREAEGRAVITAWQRSGESLSSFARVHGVKPQRIVWWAARLKAGTSEPVRFHPVRLVELRRRSGDDRREAIEVVLADGRRVRVPEGFAAEDLARVLTVLERGA